MDQTTKRDKVTIDLPYPVGKETKLFVPDNSPLT